VPLPTASGPGLALQGVRIALIEDDRAAAKVYARWIEAAGARVIWLANLEQFKTALEGTAGWCQDPKSAPSLVLTDLILPDGSGLEIVSLWRKQFPQAPVLVCTAFATVENAVEAMKMGAFDFLRKPIQEEEVVLVLRKAWAHASVLQENESLSSAVRILGMAQTLSGLTDKAQLLKTFGRLLYRELKSTECYVFNYTANKKSVECLLDLRLPGMARKVPEEVAQMHLASQLANLPDAPENFADIDLSRSELPEVIESREKSSIVVVVNSPTGNMGMLVLLQDPSTANEPSRREELHPIFVQAARAFQSIDVAAALSFVDELTGLYNQRFLEVALTNEVARANRYGAPLSLLFVDLDKFKEINDSHGHIVGSQMIKEASKILKQSMRDSDYLLRYGGDEFCAILPSTPAGGAHVVAERIRATFESSMFDLREITGVETARDLNVTTSIGIATFPECAREPRDLIQAADTAMYVSKRGGKNRLTHAPTKDNSGI
jgi:two-component system, cell cycle response regulator